MKINLMQKNLVNTLSACAILVASVSFTQVAAASSVQLPNSTVTMFDVASGQTDFSWDEHSEFDITGNTVTVKSNDILNGLTLVGTLYEFVIPNFYDPLPVKNITVEMTGGNTGASSADVPGVLDIIGADSAFGKPAPALPVVGVFVNGKSTPTTAVEFWEMFPNPDFEIVKIFAPVAFELLDIKIMTQSTAVPIPAAAWLFGSGLLGLVGVARAQKRVGAS